MTTDEDAGRGAVPGPGESDRTRTDDVDGGDAQGMAIGRYSLLEKIGEGGMGEVWLAHQQEPVRRRVALKLVKSGLNSREVIARFESERQALALMDHPAIARVFDAGSTPLGAPYFVMEHVAGVPITTYCDNHRLSTRDRLELFMRVCEGVQHAHQKAIIHRDLKPSNILVTEVDGRPAPKIIDFGVAKALTHKLTLDTLFTRVGDLVGTPEYMSPEQANSSGEDIDTRSDVYSLGIILYELLAGVPPLDLKRIALAEFLRRLREDDPLRPSTKLLATDPETSATVARNRQTVPLALSEQLRGELDSIALKALEKERSRRYGSPSDFAADIRRFLNNEAVFAVPQSAWYRARKFARRNRGALVTSAAFVLVLMLATSVSVWQSVRATRQRDRADAAAAEAQVVKDFLQNDVLAQAGASSQSGPAFDPDPDLKVRTALDRAAARIAGKFDNQPDVEAAIRDTIGQTYRDLGQYPEAREHMQRALDLYRRTVGGDSPKALSAMRRLGDLSELQGKYGEAEALFRQTLESQTRVLGPEHPDTLISMRSLTTAYYQQGKYAPAEELGNQILEIQRRVLGPEAPDTMDAMATLAIVYYLQGKFARAESLWAQSLEITRRAEGPRHPATLALMANLAAVYDEQGKYPEAEALGSETLEIKRRVLGPEHPNTLMSANNLALTYYAEGRYAEAEVLHGQTRDIRRRILGPEHPKTLTSTNFLADAYMVQGKYAQAEAQFRPTLEAMRRVLGPEHPDLLVLLADMASLYQRQGKYDTAEAFAAQCLAGRRQVLGADHAHTMAAAADLALALLSQDKFTESEPLAREAAEYGRTKQPDDWQRFRAESLLGASLAGEGKFAEAEPLLLEGYAGMTARTERIAVPNRHHIDRVRAWIVQLYAAWGKPEKAAEWRQQAPPKAGSP